MSSPSPTEMQPLLACFNARRFAEMEAQARSLLVRYPASGMVWKALAIALQIQGKDALAALQNACTLLPGDPEPPSNLGALHAAAGRLDEAAASYRRALAIKPDFADAHGNLGLTLTRQGQLDAAVSSLRRAVQLKPDFTEAHNNLGNALMLQGRAEEAAQNFRRALALNPQHLRANASLGAALNELGHADEALASYRRAAQLRPDLPGLQFDLGSLLLRQGRFAEALPCLRLAVQQEPRRAAAQSNLGLALLNLGQVDEAVACYRQALALEPASVDLLNNLGNALKIRGELDEAMACYRQAIALQPAHTAAHNNLAVVFREQGRIEEAAACYQRILELEPLNLVARSDLLFVRNYADGAGQTAALLAQAREFGALAESVARPFSDWPSMQTRNSGRPLRVGFVSGDLRAHPVGYFLQGLLAGLSEQVQVFAYSNSNTEDETTAALRARCHQWRNIAALADEPAARLIRDEDGIDILIDLAGHTAANRLPLFAWKPAPMQASWLGYCATTGLAAIDHFIADPWIAPEAAQAEFSETLLRLPETFLCFTPPALDLPVAPLPAESRGHITFGSFNKLTKMTDTVLATWARVLHAVPGSRLHLKTRELDAAPTRQAVAERFAAQGIAAERLLLEGSTPGRTEHLARYAEIDIALDPFPYPGTTTSVEGLWMGVPVLTMRGERALGRQGESGLHNLNLADWIAADPDDYVGRAARLAADLTALAALRQGLRPRLLASPLCDAPRFAANFERTLRAMAGLST